MATNGPWAALAVASSLAATPSQAQTATPSANTPSRQTVETCLAETARAIDPKAEFFVEPKYGVRGRPLAVSQITKTPDGKDLQWSLTSTLTTFTPPPSDLDPPRNAPPEGISSIYGRSPVDQSNAEYAKVGDRPGRITGPITRAPDPKAVDALKDVSARAERAYTSCLKKGLGL
ncbi:MAG: hypothetical protein WAO98_09450 [Alphaproteobacteria bacterium]